MFTIAALFCGGQKCRGDVACGEGESHPERVGWSCHHHRHHINHVCRHFRFASMSLLCQHRLLRFCYFIPFLHFNYIPNAYTSTFNASANIHFELVAHVQYCICFLVCSRYHHHHRQLFLSTLSLALHFSMFFFLGVFFASAFLFCCSLVSALHDENTQNCLLNAIFSMPRTCYKCSNMFSLIIRHNHAASIYIVNCFS